MKNQTTEAAPAIDRAFLNIVSAHKGGAVISELSAALKQVTAAVQQTGRAGTVTFKMSLRPAGKGTAGTLIFEGDVKTAPPKLDAQASIFYADGDFNLVREDPNQTKLDLRVAEAPDKPTEPLRKAVAS